MCVRVWPSSAVASPQFARASEGPSTAYSNGCLGFSFGSTTSFRVIIYNFRYIRITKCVELATNKLHYRWSIFP